MSIKKSEPSAISVERARRKLAEQQDGQRRMAELDREAAAVRKNMERLRELRLAKQADKKAEAAEAATHRPAGKKTIRKTV
jgi:hypothetical protein